MKLGNDWPIDEREDALVAALVALHRKRRLEATPRARGGEYQRVVSHFERRAERLRGEKLVTDELVDRLFAAHAEVGPRPIHRELELRGTPGGVAAGRFRVRNHGSSPHAFELAAGDPISGRSPRAVRLEPARGTLEPGAVCWVRIEVSLAGFSADDRSTLPVHCRWDAGWERLWLVAVADTREGSAR